MKQIPFSFITTNITKIIFLQSFLMTLLIAQKIDLEINVSAKEIFLSDLVTLTITTINIAEEDIVISASHFNNLGRFSFQNQMAIVDGQIERKKTFYYKLQPLKVGINTITVSANGLKKGPVAIKIIRGNESLPPTKEKKKQFFKPQNNFMVKNFLNKKELRLNEMAILRTVVYFIDLPDNLYVSKRFINEGLNIIPIEIEREPFTIEEIGGKFYKTQTVDKYLVYPYKVGTLEIKDGIYAIEEKKSSFFSLKKEIKVTVPEIKVVVKEYENPPLGFENNWGDFSVSYEIDEIKTDINSPLKLLVSIAGAGNFNTISPINLSPWSENLLLKEGKVKDDFKVMNGKLTGSKTFEYFILAERPGEYQLPPIKLVNFSPQKNDYVPLEKKLPLIEFESSKELTLLKSKTNGNVSENQFVIHPLENDSSTEVFFLKNPLWQQLIFFSFFLTFLFWKKKNNFNEIFSSKNPKKILMQKLNHLAKVHQENKQENHIEDFSLLIACLNDYLTKIVPLPFKSIKELKTSLPKKEINSGSTHSIIVRIESYEKMIYGNKDRYSFDFLEEIEKLLTELKRGLL